MEYPYDALQVFAREYETSVPIPKMLETGNYWLKLEALFAEIWNGADANEELKTLSEQSTRLPVSRSKRPTLRIRPEMAKRMRWNTWMKIITGSRLWIIKVNKR